MSHIEDVCRELNNWFDVERAFGDFEITEEGLTSFGLDVEVGQYYRIIGSIFNDGVYKVGEEATFVPEKFSGAVWAMAVPPAVIALAGEIEDWLKKYGDVMNSPFQSESFGGYSYSKGSAGSSNNSNSANAADWRKVFGSRLNAYRKINDRFGIRRYKDVGHGQVSAYVTRTEVNDMIQDATHNVLRAEDD